MNYLDVYYSRINHMGETVGERIRNNGIRSFERWLNESPFTIQNLSVERGLYFNGIIERSKDKAELKIMHLYVALDIPIRVGDIVLWPQESGISEHWLILQERKEANPKYHTFWIIKCNYEIKWIDSNGYLQKSWAYTVSSVDEKVKANFRMWHNLVSPQPNKYAEIIMPRHIVDRSTNFIIEDEGWKMIEADFTSVEGIIYMSLTESKINYQYDDRDIDVADLDKYKFPTLHTLYTVGEQIVPEFSAETLNQLEIELLKPQDCDFIDDNFVAVAPGQCVITMRIKNRPAVTKTFEIIINNANEELIAFIAGPDKLRLDRQDIYTLQANIPIMDANVTMTIEEDVTAKHKPSDYATIKQAVDDLGELIPNQYIVHANNKNKLGKLVLAAEYEGNKYTKIVEIIPLW